MMTGRFSRAARCGSASSIAWPPASSSSKWSMPITQRDRQADRAPQRVAPADPVPELEHVRGVDAERATSFAFVDSATKCFATAASSFELLEQPRARARRVRDRLLRRERLARDDEQRAAPDRGRFSVSTRCVPSTFDTKCARSPRLPVRPQRLGRPSPGRGREPPMPMLTTSVMRLAGVALPGARRAAAR